MLVLDATQWAALWYIGGMISGSIASYSRRCIRMFTPSAAAKQPTSASAWYDGGFNNDLS